MICLFIIYQIAHLGHFLVFHEEFEDGIVNRVGNDGHKAYRFDDGANVFLFLKSGGWKG